jgi:hypothetical protein
MTKEKPVLELPASVASIMQWLSELPPTTMIEATVYNSFKKESGTRKVQRLTTR